jgi:hypothetical protein
MRLARGYALGIAITFALLAGFTPSSHLERAADGWIREALVSASWVVAGLSAISAAFALSERSGHGERLGVLALQGVPRREILTARFLVIGARVALGVAFPAALLVLLSFSRSPRFFGSGWVAAWLGFIVVYAALLGAGICALAAIAAAVSRRHARAALLALLLGPELLRWADFHSVPSVSRACAWAIERTEARSS